MPPSLGRHAVMPLAALCAALFGLLPLGAAAAVTFTYDGYTAELPVHPRKADAQ